MFRDYELQGKLTISNVSQEDWEYIIETLYKDPKFQEISKKNVENRAKLPYNHSMGSKSFQSALYKKGEWVSVEAESRYERMKELATKNLEEGAEPLTQDEIACTVLGSRPGYKKGFGHGPKPLSSSQSFHSIDEHRQQADMIKKLQATVESLHKERDETKEKLEKFEDAQQKFEDAQQRMMQQILQMQLQLQLALGTSTNADMPPES